MDNFLLQYLIGLVVTVVPVWIIIKRTGLNPALSFLLLVPLLGGLVVLVTLASTDWPLNKAGGRS